MQNNNIEGFDLSSILPLLVVGGIAYFVLKGGDLGSFGLSLGQSTEEKAKAYEEKAKKYQELAQALKEIAAKEQELKELKQALKGV